MGKTFNRDVDINGGLTVKPSAYSTIINGETGYLVKLQAYAYDVLKGIRQGVLAINLDRLSTKALTSWDGNPDCALKIQAFNRALNGSNGGTRGLDITARNRDSGTESWINSIYATAEVSNGTVATSYVAQFNMKNNGVVTDGYGLVIQDQSQGSTTNDYFLRITTSTINPATGARTAAINIASKDTAGITNLIYAESETLDCATVAGGTYTTAEGYFTVKVGANTYRMPFFTAAD